MKEGITSVILLLVLFVGVSGCGTFEGVGKDVEDLGHEIQEEAKD